MSVRIVSLIFLFITRIIFSAEKSIADITPNIYRAAYVGKYKSLKNMISYYENVTFIKGFY